MRTEFTSNWKQLRWGYYKKEFYHPIEKELWWLFCEFVEPNWLFYIRGQNINSKRVHLKEVYFSISIQVIPEIKRLSTRYLRKYMEALNAIK